jgi:hypothetical protein
MSADPKYVTPAEAADPPRRVEPADDPAKNGYGSYVAEAARARVERR